MTNYVDGEGQRILLGRRKGGEAPGPVSRVKSLLITGKKNR